MANQSENWTVVADPIGTSSDFIIGIMMLIAGGIFFCIGFIGNGLVILIYTVSPLLRKTHNIFIINLAVIDMVILLFSSPVVVAIYYGDKGQLLENNHSLCTFVGVLLAIVFSVSASAMASIAMNRYVCINWPMESKKYFTTKRCILLVLSVWIYETIIYLPLFAGWGYIRYDLEIASCVIDILQSPSFNFFSLFFAIVLPSLVTLVCYIGILMKVRQSKRQLQAHQSDATPAIKKGELRLAFQMLIIVVICYLAWGPYICILRLYTGVVHWVLKGVVSTGLVLNSVVNPFVYLYYNRTFRREFLRIIRCRGIAVQDLGHSRTEGGHSMVVTQTTIE